MARETRLPRPNPATHPPTTTYTPKTTSLAHQGEVVLPHPSRPPKPRSCCQSRNPASKQRRGEPDTIAGAASNGQFAMSAPDLRVYFGGAM